MAPTRVPRRMAARRGRGGRRGGPSAEGAVAPGRPRPPPGRSAVAGWFHPGQGERPPHPRHASPRDSNMRTVSSSLPSSIATDQPRARIRATATSSTTARWTGAIPPTASRRPGERHALAVGHGPVGPALRRRAGRTGRRAWSASRGAASAPGVGHSKRPPTVSRSKRSAAPRATSAVGRPRIGASVRIERDHPLRRGRLDALLQRPRLSRPALRQARPARPALRRLGNRRGGVGGLVVDHDHLGDPGGPDDASSSGPIRRLVSRRDHDGDGWIGVMDGRTAGATRAACEAVRDATRRDANPDRQAPDDRRAGFAAIPLDHVGDDPCARRHERQPTTRVARATRPDTARGGAAVGRSDERGRLPFDEVP